jgi:hypothetical protein
VHHVQQVRHALNLIDHHRRASRFAAHEVAQPFRPCMEFPGNVGQQKIDEKRIGKELAKQRRFSCPPGTEQEETLVSGRLKKSTL